MQCENYFEHVVYGVFTNLKILSLTEPPFHRLQIGQYVLIMFGKLSRFNKLYNESHIVLAFLSFD